MVSMVTSTGFALTARKIHQDARKELAAPCIRPPLPASERPLADSKLQGGSASLLECPSCFSDFVSRPRPHATANVARGEAELYLRMPRSADHVEKSWDHAAGALVVTEAGGRVTDLAGRALDFTRGRELTANRGIVATNGLVHADVLAAVASLGLLR